MLQEDGKSKSGGGDMPVVFPRICLRSLISFFLLLKDRESASELDSTALEQCTVSGDFTSGLISKGEMTLPPTSIPTNFSEAIHGAQNNTTITNCSPGQEPGWIATVVPVYILVISVLGIVFNVFVMLVFCLHKKPCTKAEIYLSNLAATDLMLMTCLPFWAVNVSRNYRWTFGLFMCKFVNTGIHMNVYCSIYFLVLISIDRYLALVHTMSLNRMRSRKCAKLGCLLVWGLGLLLSAPTIHYRVLKYENECTSCILKYESEHTQLVFEALLITFSFIIPISIISYCTVRIINALRNRFLEQSNSQTTDHKATNLMLAVLLAFLICWLPFHLLRMAGMLWRAGILSLNIQSFSICSHIFMYLAFFNSVLNPILYVIVGKNFQKKVKELFKQQRRKMTLNMTSVRSSLMRSTKTNGRLPRSDLQHDCS